MGTGNRLTGGVEHELRIQGLVVPYTRVGRERWTDRATRYLGWKDDAQWQLRLEWQRLGYREPLEVWWVAVVWCARWGRTTASTADADNLGKAVLDAAQGIVYPDDKYVVGMASVRLWCTERGQEGAVLQLYQLPGQPKLAPAQPITRRRVVSLPLPSGWGILDEPASGAGATGEKEPRT